MLQTICKSHFGNENILNRNNYLLVAGKHHGFRSNIHKLYIFLPHPFLLPLVHVH